MDWPSRLKVALGAARGLAYLHSSSSVGIPIVHRDFKSTNVLLNANFEAKVTKLRYFFMKHGHYKAFLTNAQFATLHRYLILA